MEDIMETTENKPDAANPAPKSAVVDAIFDVVTSRAAQGLAYAKRALEAAARYLDERAKRVGELGVKIAPKREAVVEDATATKPA
jgi:hypothetical protein